MGYETPDAYNQPEHFGLVTVGQVEWSSGYYKFDTTVAWHHPGTGAFFYAEDSGCSCPEPFEGFTSLDSLTPITDLEGFATQLRHRNANRVPSEQGVEYDRSAPIAELLEHLNKAGLR